MLSTFSRFAQDAVYPYGSGGPNASFALITRNYMKHYGATREDFGKICVAQRDNALKFPYALMKKPLTREVGGFRIGQSVVHAKFGPGVIIDAEGQGGDARVQVNFGGHGVKWLAVAVAKLHAA